MLGSDEIHMKSHVGYVIAMFHDVVCGWIIPTLIALASGCAVGAAPKEGSGYDDRWIPLSDVYPDVVDATLADWNGRGLDDTSRCDPHIARVVLMGDAEFNRLIPNKCGFFQPRMWTIILPVGAADATIEHETLHWLAGCTGRDADYDVRHRDSELFGPTGISSVFFDCSNTIHPL